MPLQWKGLIVNLMKKGIRRNLATIGVSPCRKGVLQRFLYNSLVKRLDGGNRDILSACRLLLLALVTPTFEYGSEVWEVNRSQAAALESVLLLLQC